MGYYTDFRLIILKGKFNNSLHFVNDKDTINSIVNYLSSLSYYDSLTYIDMINDVATIKWYDWLNDMRKLAQHFPDYHFILTGDGEYPYDTWTANFENNKYCIRNDEYDYEGNIVKERTNKPIIWKTEGEEK